MQRNKPSISTIANTISSVPKFDFHNIVPLKNSSFASTSITYELEVALVDNFAAADHLKAELALLGFSANITPIYQKGIQKHQVSIGPYTDKKQATRAQQLLKMHKINNTLKTLAN